MVLGPPLGEDSYIPSVRGTDLHKELQLGVRMVQDWGRRKHVFQLMERLLSLESPLEGRSWRGKLGVGVHNLAVIPDK